MIIATDGSIRLKGNVLTKLFRMSTGLSIIGLGTVFGLKDTLSPYTGRALQAEAARRAILDAGLEPKDIEGAVQIVHTGGESHLEADSFARVLGLPVKFYFLVGRGGSKAGYGIASVSKFLELGIAKYAVLVGSSLSWTSTHKRKDVGRNVHRIENEGAWGRPFGDTVAVTGHSLTMSRHMYEYGTTHEQLGMIPVQTREWACRNPNAKFYGKPITIDDYLKSPYVCYPYRLFDMSVNTDGATAIVITLSENAKGMPKQPVHILGIGFGDQMGKLWWEQRNYTTMAVKTAKEDAFRQANVQLKDLDFAQLYDCFSGEVLFQLEDYGWCAKGKGGKFVSEGHIGPGGDIPVNTSGGLLSAYHFGDLTGLSEAILQIRGEADHQRQLSKAEVGIATASGGDALHPVCQIHSCIVLGAQKTGS